MRQRRGRFRLRFLDLDLRELLLEPADLVLELALRELRLAHVRVVGFLGLLQLGGVDGEVGLELLQLARERAGELHVAGAVIGQDAPLELLRAVGLAFTWPFSRSATPAMLASARLYCVIFWRNSVRAASISASGFASSMPLMNRPTKPRNRRPMRANMRYTPPPSKRVLGAYRRAKTSDDFADVVPPSVRWSR